MSRKPWALLLAAMLIAAGAGSTQAATIAPAFAADYSITDLGPVPLLPTPYGGLTLLAGDSNTLLIGGAANGGAGAIYSVGVTRDGAGHITGFSGSASLYATAPQIDGGLAYGPGGVLFATGYPTNTLLQYLPGSATPDKIIDLSTPAGGSLSASVGTLVFVPPGQPGAGSMKIAVYNTGDFYTVALTPDGFGTYDIASATLETNTGGGPEGIVYVPTGSPGFAVPSMLLSQYAFGKVEAFEVDAGGNPIVGTRQDFITGLGGAEGAFVDPVTGDFLFSTFGGGSSVYVVQGFAAPPPPTGVPEPSSLAIVGGLMSLFGLVRFRRPSTTAI
jgi:hypothetical protein